MRRKDLEIVEHSELLAIMNKCTTCNIALFDEKYPYIVPLNFGVAYREGVFRLYFHGANAGTKLGLLKKNSKVAFEMHKEYEVILDDLSCESSMRYESICGNGTMRLLEETEKLDALNSIMDQYAKGKKHVFNEREVKAVAVMELTVENISGKRA